MTPELRFGLFAVDPNELGADQVSDDNQIKQSICSKFK